MPRTKYPTYSLHSHLKQRYDARGNVADWDHSMYLTPIAPIINLREYVRWRSTGLAFELREAAYDVPNRTLASGIVAMGVCFISVYHYQLGL